MVRRVQKARDIGFQAVTICWKGRINLDLEVLYQELVSKAGQGVH